MRARVLLLGSAIALAACSAAPTVDEGSAASPRFTAEIRRTAFGVPHIKAEDMGGIGYGYGYASAQDNVCEIADRLLTVSGERAKFLGPGDNDANVVSDLYHRRIAQHPHTRGACARRRLRSRIQPSSAREQGQDRRSALCGRSLGA